jgi:hypothetical protein
MKTYFKVFFTKINQDLAKNIQEMFFKENFIKSS